MDIFTLVGRMSIEGLDKTKSQLTDLEKKTQQVQKGLRVAGAAFTAVGAAGLALVQSTKKINAQLGVTALNLGVTTKEMRDLTLATTNVTFPIDEVTASFDLLARAGVKDTKVLKDTATAFDTLGDATGKSASQVTKMMIPAMKTFGLTATEMAKKTDIMTYMSRESTMTMEDFNTMVGYTTPELVKAGLSMEDLTAALIYMERQGYAPGRVMTREFMKATTLAAKEQIPLTEALGMTNEELEGLKKELAGATGMTQEYADVANKQYTLMDKLKQKWSEVTLGMSGFLEPLEPVLAGMTALGPLMIFLGTSAGTAAIKWVLHTTALIAYKVAAYAAAVASRVLHVSMGPVGWAIVGISAALAVVIPLIARARSKTEDLTGAMSDLEAQTVKLNLQQEFTAEKWEEITEKGYLTEQEFGKLAKAMGLTTEALYDQLAAADMIETVWVNEGNRNIYLKNLKEIKIGLEEVARTSELTTDEMVRDIQDLTDEARDGARERTRVETDALNDRMRAAQTAHQETMDRLNEEHNTVMRNIDAQLSATVAGYQSQIEAIDNQMRAIDDAQRMRQDAERRGELEAEIAQEGDAERRVDLEERVNELVLRSGNKEWQGERKLQLKAKIAEEEDAKARQKLEEGLAKFLIEVGAQRNKEQLADDKSALLERIDMAREQARNAKDQAKEAYDYNRRLQEEALDKFITDKEKEIEILETNLEKTQNAYDRDFEAFEKLLADKTKEMEEFRTAYNKLIDELKKDITLTITTVQETIARETAAGGGAYPHPGPGIWTPSPGGGFEPSPGWPGMAPGGIAMHEVVARIGEQAPRVPEAVMPLTRETFERLGLIGGGPTININIAEMNVREEEDADRIGEAIVKRIELRTGVRIR